ncbi:DUF1214 domain-containing protein [Streptacidiphilus jiangxiensis]|uniref:DUF1214 domain-containing protein n=1 Tax=Streptacidiphilus jiangxiensis TaxID=235985 RepID=UPI0009DDBEE8|nr:DUF1214 domain-containing protein [Streptacidiphilus jiangxiensis]
MWSKRTPSPARSPPACRYWGVHLSNIWWQSLEDRSPHSSINHGNATLEPDGSVRLVVAHRDPGTPNWLNTGGRREGSVLVRWLLPEQQGIAVRPRTEVITIPHAGS